MEIPKEPVIFFKSTTSLVGPNDSLVMPRGATKVDWEVELALVMSGKALYVSRENALEFIAGYVLHNDYSERSFQLERGGQWAKGKSADTFAPLGPFLATPDELHDVGRLDMWLKVNSEVRQKNSTANMIFRCCRVGFLRQPVHDTFAGRHHKHGNSRRSGSRYEAAAVSQSGRCGRTWNRRAGRIAADRGRTGLSRGFYLFIDAHHAH